MPEVIINIDSGGEVKIEARGVAGPGCKELTKAIENAVGKTIGDQPTAEMTSTQRLGQNAVAGTGGVGGGGCRA